MPAIVNQNGLSLPTPGQGRDEVDPVAVFQYMPGVNDAAVYHQQQFRYRVAQFHMLVQRGDRRAILQCHIHVNPAFSAGLFL